MIDALLDHNLDDKNFSKDTFIRQLEVVFQTFNSSGDIYLVLMKTHCRCSNKDISGFIFIGNLSRKFMSLIFNTSVNDRLNLYECYGLNKKIPKKGLKERIWLDEHGVVPF